MLNKFQYEKILDDLKLITKSVKIIREENNPDNRKYACGLTEDLINRLYRDITEMKDKKEINGEGYGGTIYDMEEK